MCLSKGGHYKCFCAILSSEHFLKNVSVQLDVVKNVGENLTVMMYELSFPTSGGNKKTRRRELLEEIKWKQNRNWLQCWGNGILCSSPGSLRV